MDRADASVLRRHHTKLAQVVHNFFVKAATVIADARAPPPPPLAEHSDDHDRPNRWFNLVTASQLGPHVSSQDWAKWKDAPLDQVPPMIIEVCLDLRKLSPEHVLVVYDDDGATWQVSRKNKQEVVLERWLVEFDPQEREDADLPLVYKHAIVLFRLLYLLVRLMPAAPLARAGNNVDITVKIIDGRHPISSKGRIGLSKPIMVNSSQHKKLDHISHRTFRPIMTNEGTLRISTAYRTRCRFGIGTMPDTAPAVLEQPPTTTAETTSAPPQPPVLEPVRATLSVSPCTLCPGVDHQGLPQPQPIAVKLTIQPFRIGSLSTLPPPLTYGTSIGTPPADRRVLIALNRLNALLAAMLRQQRNLSSLTQLAVPITATIAIPRLVLLQHHFDGPTPELLASNTPRFLSLFGLRNRRLSTTRPQDSLILGTSAGLAVLGVGLAGISANAGDADADDISGFVRMIDLKQDLRFGLTPALTDPLNKYALLRAHHQQLGDSVNALVFYLQSHQQGSARKLSAHSAVSHLPPGSYPEASPFPSIGQRLIQLGSDCAGSGSGASGASATSATSAAGITRNRRRTSSLLAYAPPPVSLLRLPRRPPLASPPPATAPTPTLEKPPIHYENVFDDDDDTALQSSKPHCRAPDDDDDLLFTMSDMSLSKHL